MRSKAGLVAPFKSQAILRNHILSDKHESGVGSQESGVGSRESKAIFLLKTPDSRLKTPDSRLQTQDSRLKTQDSRLKSFQMSEEFREFGRKRGRESHWFLTLWMNEPELLCMQKLPAKLANIRPQLGIL